LAALKEETGWITRGDRWIKRGDLAALKEETMVDYLRRRGGLKEETVDYFRRRSALLEETKCTT
jgi:hypothetical protein